MQLAVEPLATQQADSDAERYLETKRPVVAEGFPVLLQGSVATPRCARPREGSRRRGGD